MRVKTGQNQYPCSHKYMKMVESKQIERSMLSFPEGTIFTIGDLNLPMFSWDNIRVKLGRMAMKGILRRAGKGRFYRPKISIFGEVPPGEEEIVKDLLWKGDKPIGYITGYYTWNQLGLTTQICGIIQIGINGVKKNLDRGNYIKKLENEIRRIDGYTNYNYKKNDSGIYSLLQRIGDEPQARQRAAKLRAMFDETKDYKSHKPCTCVDILVDELEHPENLLNSI